MAHGGKREGAGRPKGTPNKLTKDVREAILQVAEGLGGPEGMLRWAQTNEVNERIFWSQIYPKVLPKEVKAELTGEDGGPISVIQRVVVDPKGQK
ncbi:hypothetical protein [Cupriavidus gilardii]|uniref:Uncharacterized protein n=1 Tax=Cupriavidus gilardii TaxID=82541 RepID=A0A849BE46_9BURK|nr:hypothetical protein [Cupriavidus gilardii]KAB0597782.1 hypothetical protein F7Q96_07630 [Cupriavidus gilardii]NNH12073.1 hypothetical protein [Cupriavidus gilardii]WNG69294.1 hypothetical protein QWJ31_19535 [Cupriavidus gilardii]